MLLAAQFFQPNDVIFVPLCLLFLFIIFRSRANAVRDNSVRRIYYAAFIYKTLFVFLFTFITEYYFGGGDTGLYYQGIKDLRAALSDDANYGMLILRSSTLTGENPMAPYFYFDNYTGDFTFNYMRSTSNFFMPRLGLIPSLLFSNSYLCICFCFSFFALGGCLRLFKTFYYYYPALKKEIAIATLFLPSVTFWSSGLMKDTICLGCVGFIVYASKQILINKTKIPASLFWLISCSYLLYTIKAYIFLVLILAISIWFFAETNKLIEDKTLRQLFGLMTFVIGSGIGYLLVNYFTSQEAMQQYQLDNIVSSVEYQRKNFELIDQSSAQKTSYYAINTSNPVLLVVNSVVATFYRPFPWEIGSSAAALSAIEAMAFLLLTLHLFFSKNAGKRFRLIFKDPRILMCFVFAIVFAIGVGASTANFGALSRYKIPCMPFYMIMILVLYRNTGLPYPGWFKWIIGRTKEKPVYNVRNSRVN